MWTILSYVAAILTTSSFIPQAVQVIKTKNTEGISLSMYCMFVLGVIIWMFYGFFNGELAIGIANAITLIFASIILTYKIKNG